MDDPDWEVRVRGCRFLSTLWDYSTMNKVTSKKQKLETGPENDTNEHAGSLSWFFQIHGDILLIEAVGHSLVLLCLSFCVLLMLMPLIAPDNGFLPFCSGRITQRTEAYPRGLSNISERNPFRSGAKFERTILSARFLSSL